MKKIVFTLLFVFPFTAKAQLDKLRPGMKPEEFHQKFPAAVPDLNAMTSIIYRKDTLLGVIGESQFIAVKDSVNRYYFHSEIVVGPSAEFPKADSVAYLKLVRAAEELMGHYSDIFGTPTETKSRSPREVSSDPNVFSTVWKKPDGTVKIIVRKNIEIENYINAPVTEQRDKKKKSATYLMEIHGEGKWSKMRIEFAIGITKNQFRALMPELASQVKEFPDCWMMKDTLAKRDTEWHFWFIDNSLSGFTYDCYAGDAYGGVNKSVYPLLLKKAKAFVAEEEKSYGTATTLQAPKTDNYVPVKKVPNAFFYDDIYYNAEWEMDKGKVLFVRLHENGGKGESFLHLEVYFGEKQD